MKKISVLLFSLASTLVAMGQDYIYEKVTTAPADWEGEYLIVREIDQTNMAIIFNGALTNLDQKNNVIQTTCPHTTNGARYIVSTPEVDAATFIIEHDITAGCYYIKSKSGLWIGYNKSASNGANLKCDNQKKFENHISMENGKTNINIRAKNGLLLRFNADEGSYRFRYYEKDKKKGIKLYKKVRVVKG